MWDGKLKAVTFSFDDAVLQDKRTIDILNKYNLKATFNINSSFLGLKDQYEAFGKTINRDKFFASEIKDIYKNHEVAVHTLTHSFLPSLEDKAITWQVEEDRKTLSKLVGYEVVGMAYPCGGQNNDDRVAGVIKNTTGVKYARTTVSTYNFDLQENLFRFNPTVYYVEVDKMFELAKRFIDLKTDKPQIFYIWGHTYEMDAGVIDWEKFEELCKLISNKEDIFYGTNTEVLVPDYKQKI